MNSRLLPRAVAAWIALATGAVPAASVAQATAPAARPARVLIVSVDGLHAIDLALYVKSHPGSALAELGRRGITYTNAWTPVGDSSPGLLALATGGTPNATGIIYSPTWDRALSPPGSDCRVRGAVITIDNKINKDLNAEDAGGGLDPDKMPRDPGRGCAPVFPRDLVRTNTIFEVVQKAGGRTAWSDQHLAYNDMLLGPSGKGLDDSYALSGSAVRARERLAPIAAQDARRAEAVLHQVRGYDHLGKERVGVPRLFGATFIAFSALQKLRGHGYLNGAATPSPGLLEALEGVDAQLARIVAELKKERLFDSTLVVVTAKHGQSPIDPHRRRMVDRNMIRSAVDGVQKGLLAHSALDTIGLLWLRDSSRTDEVARVLRARMAAAGIQKVYSGEELRLVFADASTDSRGPDLLIETEPGVFYAEAGAAMIAEHGGTLDEDAHVALLVSFDGAPGSAVRTPVHTTQVAPTVLAALGLDPRALRAVQLEGTPVLPGVTWGAR